MTKSAATPDSNKSIRLLIAILFISSFLAISLRALLSEPDTLASGDKLWRLNLNITTTSIPKQTIVKIYPPFDTENIRTIQRNVTYPGFKIRKPSTEEKIRRSFSFIANNKGTQHIVAEYLLHVSQTPFPNLANTNTELSSESREEYLSDNEKLQLNSETVKNALQQLLLKQPDPAQLVKEIYRYTKMFKISNRKNIANVPRIIQKHQATPYDSALLLIALSRAAGIPARMVTGIILKENINPKPYYWVEIYQDSQWLSYDIHNGYKKTVPLNYLPLRRNAKDIVNVENGKLLKTSYELDEEYNHPYFYDNQKYNLTSIFNLNRLAPEARKELAFLLLLPLGALITVLFRHMVGIQSYGVFTPTLLALAFVYANFITTLIIFLVVIFIAIGGRSLFPATITRVPRLSIIFTLISIILAMSVSILSYFQVTQDGSIVLLPIIILTSLVDRIYSTIDKYGFAVAMNRLIWTFLLAFICLPVIQFDSLGRLILQYPEIHFATLGVILWVSIYEGTHLVKISFLKFLAEPQVTKNRRKDDKEES